MRALVLLVALLLAAPASAADWPAVVKTLGRKVARVEILTGADEQPGVCSAAWINAESGYLISAAHCYDAKPGERVDVTVNRRDAAVVRFNKLLDLAVLRVDPKSGDEAFTLAETTPAVGTEVAIVGFAFGYRAPSVQFGRIALILDDEGQQMRVDANIIAGDSGGPLIDEQGRLVGISSAVHYLGPMHAAALVPVERVREYVLQYLPRP